MTITRKKSDTNAIHCHLWHSLSCFFAAVARNSNTFTHLYEINLLSHLRSWLVKGAYVAFSPMWKWSDVTYLPVCFHPSGFCSLLRSEIDWQCHWFVVVLVCVIAPRSRAFIHGCYRSNQYARKSKRTNRSRWLKWTDFQYILNTHTFDLSSADLFHWFSFSAVFVSLLHSFGCCLKSVLNSLPKRL